MVLLIALHKYRSPSLAFHLCLNSITVVRGLTHSVRVFGFRSDIKCCENPGIYSSLSLEMNNERYNTIMAPQSASCIWLISMFEPSDLFCQSDYLYARYGFTVPRNNDQLLDTMRCDILLTYVYVCHYT